MPQLNVERTTPVSATPERVYSVVSDLAQWRPWNPWLVTEPEAHVEVEPGGKAYHWSGKRVGEGSMRVASEQASRSVELALTFLKPFKSKARARLVLEPEGEGCRVQWQMDSRLPFFLFFMTRMMRTLIGMDYERGLAMLKDYVETGSVPSKVELRGETQYAGCRFVGVSRECKIGELGERMGEDFATLGAWFGKTGTTPLGEALSIYRKWKLSDGTVRYTSGMPVSSDAAALSSLPAPLQLGQVPPLKTFVLEHVGPYRHLGNAWTTGMQMARGKELRLSKAHPPFERYLQAPAGAPGESDAETRTAIHFAVR